MLSRNRTAAIVMLFASTVLADQPKQAEPSSGLPLELGTIEFNAEPEDCDGGKCYSFTTTSKAGTSSKPGTVMVREPDGVIRGTAVFFSGGLGTAFGGSRKMTSDAREAGYRTVHVKWESGWSVGTPGALEGFRKLAVHPATLTDFIKKQFGVPDKPYVLWGSSGGAGQIAYMLSFYGMDEIVDAAIISGGFWMGRVDIGCLDEDPLNEHLQYSAAARRAIDQSFGFGRDKPGPCAQRDEKLRTRLRQSSVAFGGDYHHPNTKVYLLYGGNDRVGALNQGLRARFSRVG